MSEEKTNGYITFTKKQIVSIIPHRNSSVIDHRTNQTMNMYTIKLPSINYRHFRFGKDSQGIDRDLRTATISIGAPYVHQNEVNSELYYSYLELNRTFNVQFKGHILGKDENSRNIFDKPESAKLTGKEIIQIFHDAKEISKKKNKEIKKKKEIEDKEKKSKDKLNKNKLNKGEIQK